MSNLIRIRALVQKELAQIKNDTRMIRVLIGAPLVQLLVFGYAVNFEIDQVPTAVVDHDDTRTSRDATAALLADGTLTRAESTRDEVAALAAMDAGEVAAVLVIPPGTERARLRGEPAPVQVVIDGTDVRRSTVAASAAGRYFTSVDAKAPSVTLSPRILANPTLDTSPYMVPGLAAMILIMTTTLITSMGLARERETGTLEQVMVTPIEPWVLIVGKILPYVAIGLFDAALAIGFGAVVFDVPIRGSLVFLGVATGAYLLSTLGVGILIASVAKSQQQAFMGGFFFMIPAMLLGGNLTPIVAMPAWLVPLTWVNPLRWYIEILRANLLEGAGFFEVGPQLAALSAIGAVVMVVSVRRFHARLA